MCGPQHRNYELFGHFDMLFGTQIVFVIIFSNLMLIIFKDHGKYWHILLNSTLIKKEEGISLRDLANDVVFFGFVILLFWSMIVKSL